MKPFSFTPLLVGGLLTLAAASCQKKDIRPIEKPVDCGAFLLDSVLVRYQQTYCADPWGQVQGAQQLQATAQAYLVQQGVRLRPGALTAYGRNPASVCNACTCTTGLVVEAAIVPADLPAVQALGFTRIQ
jgi:hypothetical protein